MDWDKEVKLEKLENMITVYEEHIKTLEEENVQLQSYKDILEDREKLLEYIAEIQKTSFLFSAQATYSNDLEIKFKDLIVNSNIFIGALKETNFNYEDMNSGKLYVKEEYNLKKIYHKSNLLINRKN